MARRTPDNTSLTLEKTRYTTQNPPSVVHHTDYRNSVTSSNLFILPNSQQQLPDHSKNVPSQALVAHDIISVNRQLPAPRNNSAQIMGHARNPPLPVSRTPPPLSILPQPETMSVDWRGSSTSSSVSSIKYGSHGSRSVDIHSGGRSKPVHQSVAKRSAPAIDILNRFAATNHSSDGFKVMQFSSVDGRIDSPSPPGAHQQQLFARSPRSPDALLGSAECVKTIYSVKAPPSKWDDAQKWLSNHPSPSPPDHHLHLQPTSVSSNANGCRAFAGNTLRLLGKSCNAGNVSEQKLYDHFITNASHRQVDVDYVRASTGHHFAVQLQSSRHTKHRDRGVSVHMSETPAASSGSSSSEKKHPASPKQYNADQSRPGQSPALIVAHSPQNARKLRANNIAEITDAGALVNRKQFGWPSPVVLEQPVWENRSRKCTECGSRVTNFSNIDRFPDQFVAVNGKWESIRNARKTERTLAYNAIQPLSFKDTAEVVVSVSMKDVGTQMTPFECSGNSTSYPSKCPSPRKLSSPARHNTPARPNRSLGVAANKAGVNSQELANCHLAKLELQGLSEGERMYSFHRTTSNWSSREAEEEELGKSLRHLDLENCTGISEPSPISAWMKDERSKSVARLQREEARIQAWENHKKAKAEAELRKLEAKLEKTRSETTNKIMSRLVAAQQQAEEMRVNVRAQQMTSINKGSAKPQNIRHTAHSPLHICACFIPSP